MPKKIVSVQLMPKERELFEEARAALGVSPSELLRRALRDYLLGTRPAQSTRPAPGGE